MVWCIADKAVPVCWLCIRYYSKNCLTHCRKPTKYQQNSIKINDNQPHTASNNYRIEKRKYSCQYHVTKQSHPGDIGYKIVL